MERLGDEVGVRMSLYLSVLMFVREMGTDFVRTRSNGARMRPVATAAATATPREAQGY